MSRRKTVLITGNIGGMAAPDVPFKAVDVVAWTNADAVVSGIDPTDLLMIIMADDDEARGRLRLSEVASLTSTQARLALVPESGAPYTPASDGIETGTVAAAAGIVARPGRVQVSDPSEGGTHTRVGGGRFVPWDRVHDVLPAVAVDPETGLAILGDDYSTQDPS